MVPNLPVETWSQIVSYLKANEAINLCSVNRVLYIVAQSIRYKEVAVTRVSHGKVAQLRHLQRSAEVAEHVTSLLVDFAAFTKLEYSHPLQKKVLHLSKELINFVTCRSDFKDPEFYMPTDKSACEVFDILLDAVDRMHNLRHLRLSGFAPSGFETYGIKLWESVSGHITSLTIDDLCPRQKAGFLEKFSRGLSRLTSLSLSFCRAWSVAECTQVARLINSAKGSLEMLAVDPSSFESPRIVQLIFANIDHLERLKQIRISTNADSNQAIIDFINRHGLHLEELSIQLFSESFALSRLNLPYLRKLQVEYCSLIPNKRHWAGILHFDGLEDLTFGSSPELHLICDAFQRSGIGHRLRRLSLRGFWVSAESLDLLALTFPELRTLTISLLRTSGVISDDFPMMYPAPQWKLYDLIIVPLNSDDPPDSDMYKDMKTVANRFPSIRSFCGSGHMDVPRRLQSE